MLFALLFFLPYHLTAQYTIANGDWEDTLIWANGNIPSSTDTTFIKHFVTFNQDLTFDSGARLTIDSGAILCGHNHIDVWCGAVITNNGELKALSMYVEGEVYCYGYFHLEVGATITTTCGYWHSSGGGKVGGSFDCSDTTLTTPPDTASNDTIPPVPPPEPQCSLFVANVFSPNGDGHNDLLMVRGPDIRNIHLRLYDRWGELVFETRDKDVGWNGMHRGRPVNTGVFVYVVTAWCTLSGKDMIRSGNVSVVR